MNQKIGFDLDGIFIGSPILFPKSIVERLYKKAGKKLSYRMPGGIEKKVRVISHTRFLRPPIVKNINSLNSFNNSGDLIYLISSRFSFLENITSNWISHNRLGGHFKKMYFNFGDEQPHIFKERILREIGINKFVDDDFDLLLYLSGRNPNIRFFWVSPQGIQRKLPPNLIRVKDVNDFIKKFVKN